MERYISSSLWSPSREYQEGELVSAAAFCAILIELRHRLAYVNVFYRLGNDEDDGSTGDQGRRSLEREFCISAVGFADTLGILVASLVSIVLEPWLCGVQVGRGRMFCKSL
jgi:hypothetical protein